MDTVGTVFSNAALNKMNRWFGVFERCFEQNEPLISNGCGFERCVDSMNSVDVSSKTALNRWVQTDVSLRKLSTTQRSP